jgi:hypothetical protein
MAVRRNDSVDDLDGSPQSRLHNGTVPSSYSHVQGWSALENIHISLRYPSVACFLSSERILQAPTAVSTCKLTMIQRPTGPATPAKVRLFDVIAPV